MEFGGVGCCALVVRGKKILTIECAKGRGTIIPGGKFEPSKDAGFFDAAKRELREETGVEGRALKLLFHAIDPAGFYCYTFWVYNYDMSGILEETEEGKIGWSDWPESKVFNPYYELMKVAMVDSGIKELNIWG